MIAQELKDKRAELGLTQTELAKVLNRTRDCIAKWESGKYPIPTKIAEIIWKMKLNEMG